MVKLRQKFKFWIFIIMLFTPTFLFYDTTGGSTYLSTPLPLLNYQNIAGTIQIVEDSSIQNAFQQKVSLRIQELIKTQNESELVKCIVLLQDQPTSTIANQLKSSSTITNLVDLRKQIFRETRAQITPIQDLVSAKIVALGGKILRKYTIINALSVQISLNKIALLAKFPEVARIEPDYQLQVQLNYSRPIVVNTTAPGWNPAFNGTGIVVAVCDTGIDKTHPAIVGKVIAEKSFVDGEPADDLDGHGTHVAGIIASTDSTYMGMGVNISLVNVKIMNSEGSGDTSNLIAGVEWLLTNTSRGADVINLSAGTSTIIANGDSSIATFVDAIVSSYNIVWINAAGNLGTSGLEVPGDAINCISVANFNDNNNLDPSAWVISGSSSQGPTVDGRKKPDIAAPGTGIQSCNYKWEGESDFVLKSGTSMAAPHVAGAAALLLHYLKTYRQSLQSSYALVTKAILLHTAYDLGAAGYDYAYGYGAVDMGSVWNFLQSGDIEVEQLVPSYSKAKYRLNLTTSQWINLTLVWNRQASTDFVSTDFVQIYYRDLANADLRLQNATGYQVAASTSTVDNVEQIQYNATAGIYYLFVEVVNFNGNNAFSYVLLSNSSITFLEKIYTPTWLDILVIVSIIGIIAIITIYLILWYRDRKKKAKEEPHEFQVTGEDMGTWPEWTGDY
ncbi:MAG: S8 family serine peptidase [Candidatus Helarchaeota archaeon]